MQDKFKPDKTFFRYVKGEYSRRKFGYNQTGILKSVQEKLLFASYGLTAWISTNRGAEWAFAILGLEEIEPHYAFQYYFNNNGEHKKLSSNGSLRIFRKRPKETIGLPSVAIDLAKKVVYTEGWPVPEETVFEFVFKCYRSWLQTTSGKEWAKRKFTSFGFVENKEETAYRFQTKNGQVYWFDDNQIIAKPCTYQVCDCCEYEFPCVDNHNGCGPMCNRCYAEHFAEPEVLAACNRLECKKIECHNYLSDIKLYETIENVHSLPIQWREHG